MSVECHDNNLHTIQSKATSARSKALAAPSHAARGSHGRLLRTNSGDDGGRSLIALARRWCSLTCIQLLTLSQLSHTLTRALSQRSLASLVLLIFFIKHRASHTCKGSARSARSAAIAAAQRQCGPVRVWTDRQCRASLDSTRIAIAIAACRLTQVAQAAVSSMVSRSHMRDGWGVGHPHVLELAVWHVWHSCRRRRWFADLFALLCCAVQACVHSALGASLVGSAGVCVCCVQ